MEGAIWLQPLDSVAEDVLEFLRKRLTGIFHREAIALPPLPLPAESFDFTRGQYFSPLILRMLIMRSRSSEMGKVLGIADVDAYVPGLNFVFGEAECPGRAAVIYLARLRPEFYGLPRSDGVFMERALKEAVHELGHTYGLRHCHNRRCVMAFSNSIFDNDFKGCGFCHSCSRRISRTLPEYYPWKYPKSWNGNGSGE